MLYKSADPNKTDSNETVGSGGDGLWDKLTSDKKLMAAAATGLLGGTVGALVAPDFVYKKPTWYNRFLLGTGSGLSSAAIVYATMMALEGKGDPRGLLDKAKDTGQQALASIQGTRPGENVVRQMTDWGRGMHGLYGTGAKGWIVRNWWKRPWRTIYNLFSGGKRQEDPDTLSLPFAASAATALALPAAAGVGITRGLRNIQRTKYLRELLRNGGVQVKDLIPLSQMQPGQGGMYTGVEKHLEQLFKNLDNIKARPKQWAQALVATPADITGKLFAAIAASKNHPGARRGLSWLLNSGNWLQSKAYNQFMHNPVLQIPGVRSSVSIPSSKGIFGLLNQHQKTLIRQIGNSSADRDALLNLVRSNRWNKGAFRGSKLSRALGILTTLAALGLQGGMTSSNMNDPYERWINDIGVKYKE